MGTQRAYRDRDESEVAVLDALVERHEEGLTVLELRTQADVDIDELEAALGNLKDDDLITVEQNGERTVIRPDESVVPDPDDRRNQETLVEWIRDRLPF